MKLIFVLVSLVMFGLGAEVVSAGEGYEGFRIVQVQITGGSGKTLEDFIEIKNESTTDANLQGVKIVKRTSTGKTDTVLYSFDQSYVVKSGSSIIWSNNSIKASLSAEFSNDSFISDDNGVALRYGDKDTGVLVDSVSWGKSDNSFTKAVSVNPTANQSIQKSLSGFVVAASNSRFTQVTSQVAPGVSQSSAQSVSYSDNATSKVIISEIYPDPVGQERGREWVELMNISSDSLYIDGYVLSDASSKVDKANAYVMGGVYLPSGGVAQILIPDSKFSLDNSAEDVYLIAPDGTVVHKVAYSGSVEGSSYQKIGGKYFWSNPTPNSKNFKEAGDCKDACGLVVKKVFKSKDEQGVGSYIEFLNTSDSYVSTKSFRFAINDLKVKKVFGLVDMYVRPGEVWRLEVNEDFGLLPRAGFEVLVSAGDEFREKFVVPEFEFSSVYDFESGSASVQDKLESSNNSLVINEVMSNPGGNQVEFIELLNNSGKKVDLSPYLLSVNGVKVKLVGEVLTGGLYTVKDFAYIRNSGGEIVLLRGDEEIDRVEYPELASGVSYSRFDDGFNITSSSTFGEINVLTIPSASEDKSPSSASTQSKVYGISVINKLLKENGLIKKDLLDSQKALKLVSSKLVSDIDNLSGEIKSSASAFGFSDLLLSLIVLYFLANKLRVKVSAPRSLKGLMDRKGMIIEANQRTIE